MCKKSKIEERSFDNLKRTVSVISSDPPCKYGNAYLQRYVLKLCLIKYELDINIFVSFDYFYLRVLCKSDLRISCILEVMEIGETHRN